MTTMLLALILLVLFLTLLSFPNGAPVAQLDRVRPPLAENQKLGPVRCGESLPRASRPVAQPDRASGYEPE